jgi:hypothetical protein
MRAMFGFVVGLLVCALASSAVARSKNKRAKRDRGPKFLVGVLTEQADRKCTGKDEAEWVNRHYEVGFVPIVARKRKLKRHVGKVVVIRGKVARKYQRKAVAHSGDCPAMQMRSDWIAGLHGMRVRRSGGVGFGAFKARRIKRFRSLKTKRQGDELLVTLRNPFRMNLGHMQVRVHYEGCYGKPGRTVLSDSRPELRRRGKMQVRFPLIIEKNRAGRGQVSYAAASLELSARNPKVVWDFDLPLSSVGIDVKCPKKRR